MNKILNVGPSPHIRTKETVEKIMYDVIIAMIPIVLAAVIFFGFKALGIIAISTGTAVLTETLCQKLMKKEVKVKDGSAIITGILVGLSLPITSPMAIVIIGSFVAIFLGKMVFGGLGHNIFNPAIVGRVFVLIAWPAYIAVNKYDELTGATMLEVMKRNLPNNEALIGNGSDILNAFIGNMGGAIGETSALAILIGGLYLIYKKHISWKIPAIIIGIVAISSVFAGEDPLLQIFSGGLFLGAFFMATDMVTSPHTEKGKIIFAIGIGILITLIRLKGGYPEGLAFAILLMNSVVPLINNYIRPKKYGEVASKNDK